MKRFRISRVYATRWEWVVEAKNKKEALKMLDDNEQTPEGEASETWLGQVLSNPARDLQDEVEEI